MSRVSLLPILCSWCVAVLLTLCSGCGTTKSSLATQQLLLSDAIDRSVDQIDFSVLKDQKVYLDHQYIDPIKSNNSVTHNYIISALRQQLFAAQCVVMESKEEADYVIEARVGALGTDEHDVTFGLPASSALSSAAAIMPNAPPIPAIPEVSLARRQAQQGAAKVSVFAYHRESGTRVWQSGANSATSHAKSLWLLGAGPFQKGTIYDGAQFAGARLSLSDGKERNHVGDERVAIDAERIFQPPSDLKALEESGEVQVAEQTEDAASSEAPATQR